MTPTQRQLVVDHMAIVPTLARRAGLYDRDEYEGVAYEALCHAAITFDPKLGTSFDWWASTCVRRRLVDFVRRWTGYRRATPIALVELCDDPPLDAEPVDELVVRRIDAAERIEQLSPHAREVFDLMAVGMDQNGAARALGITQGAVSHRLRAERARH